MNGVTGKVTGVVLAGGQGRRMGTVDKGLQLLHGKPMVAAVLARLAPQVDEILINANQNLQAYENFGHRVVPDAIGGFAGPLAGLHAGLCAAGHPLVLTAPCDSPFLPLDLFSRLKNAIQDNDLAVANPEKLAELVALWDTEAERHGVLPLDDRGFTLFGPRFRERSPHPENRRYVYRPPMSPLPAQASAAIGGRHVDLTATVTLAPGDEGVLFATGTQNSGISMFVQGGRLVLDYNAFSDHTIIESDVELPVGDVELAVRLRRGEGMLGSAEIVVDGRVAGAADLGLFMRMISSIGPSVGGDHGSAVSQRYAAPYEFTGVLHEIVVHASPEKYADVEAAAERAEQTRQ